MPPTFINIVHKTRDQLQSNHVIQSQSTWGGGGDFSTGLVQLSEMTARD